MIPKSGSFSSWDETQQQDDSIINALRFVSQAIYTGLVKQLFKGC